MGEKRNNLLALVTASLFIAIGLSAPAQAQEIHAEPARADLKAAAFARDLPSALTHRAARLVNMDTFLQMDSEANTMILDTRSRADFASGHLYGAVNVPLSEMTLLNLGDAIDDRETRILIYGDENIAESAARPDYEVSTLPINLLSYISLHRYGYFELYELSEKVSIRDPRVDWQDGASQLASLETVRFN